MIVAILNFKLVRCYNTYFPGGLVAETPHSQCRGPGSIPGQGTRPHMPKLRVCMLQLKISHAAIETRCNLIKCVSFKKIKSHVISV